VSAFDYIAPGFGLLIVGLVPLYAFCYLLYFIIGLPLRREARAGLFIDLAETGLRRGQSIEQTVVSLSRTRDRTLVVRFHLLAACLESGWSLMPALEKVAGFLPPQIMAMLKVGAEIGDTRRVLPACRRFLRDGASHVQSAYNYLVVLAFVLIPVIPAVFWMMTVFVVPKYQAIFADMMEDGDHTLPFLPLDVAVVLAHIQISLAVLFYLGAVFYIGGPRLVAWIGAGLSMPSFDGLLYRVPWRRKRMQRDFAAMLGLLLDAEVPEDRALLLAAASTANSVFVSRAERAVAQLKAGARLTDVMVLFDRSGEFQWRLSNASKSGGRFFYALSGWLESLEARAFRQQQAFAQVVTTALVLYNGAMVSLFAIFVFRGFTQILEQGVLW
jgi:type II secretory pathway component PulF